MPFALFPTPIGECGIAWRGDVVVATHLPEKTAAKTASLLATHTGTSIGKPTPQIQQAIKLITSLLEGEKTDLSEVACDLSSCDTFAQRVYEETRAIQVGETKTYGEIATRLGDRQLARKVGRVLGQNPIPIIVPCHRVIGANQKLVGFSAPGGVDTKLKMLLIEGARFGDTPGLFDGISMH